MDSILQSAVSGALVGSLYGLAALGLSLAFGVLRILNVAHGELIMLGGYAAYYLFSLLGIDPLFSLGLVFAILAVIGLILHAALFRHVVRLPEEQRIKNSLLLTFGLTLIIHTAAIQLFSADERSIFTSYSSTSWEVGTIHFPLNRLLGFVAAIVVVVLLHHFLKHTFWGKALRATSEDWKSAALAGIDVRRVYLLAFTLASGLAGLTGVFVALSFSISPSIGLQWTLKALVVVVLAGLGSVRGALVGGILLGLAEALSVLVVGGAYRELVGLVIFLIVLSIRPDGLFGGRHV